MDDIWQWLASLVAPLIAQGREALWAVAPFLLLGYVGWVMLNHADGGKKKRKKKGRGE